MKNRAFLFAVVLISGCGVDLGPVGSAASDVALFGAAGPPAPVDPVPFTDNDSFDRLLYSSMNADSDLRVSLPPGTSASATLPQRLDRWLKAVRSSQGIVATCDTNHASGLVEILPIIIDIAKRALVRAIQNALLYRPARQANAIIEVDSAQNRVVAVRFVSRQANLSSIEADRSVYAHCQ